MTNNQFMGLKKLKSNWKKIYEFFKFQNLILDIGRILIFLQSLEASESYIAQHSLNSAVVHRNHLEALLKCTF